jgi:hypothetical protein
MILKGQGYLGSTVFLDKSEWPENFEPDMEGDECGTYLYCPHCGQPNNSPEEER